MNPVVAPREGDAPMSTAVRTAEAPQAIWAPCPTCWGQRRVYTDHNGEGLVPHACPGCLGMGERLVEIVDGGRR